HALKSVIAAAAFSLACVASARSGASLPAASLAQSATLALKNPTAPFDMPAARVVNSFGGFFTFAFPAAHSAGTALRRAVTDRRRSAFGAKSRFIRSLIENADTNT